MIFPCASCSQPKRSFIQCEHLLLIVLCEPSRLFSFFWILFSKFHCKLLPSLACFQHVQPFTVGTIMLRVKNYSRFRDKSFRGSWTAQMSAWCSLQTKRRVSSPPALRWSSGRWSGPRLLLQRRSKCLTCLAQRESCCLTLTEVELREGMLRLSYPLLHALCLPWCEYNSFRFVCVLELLMMCFFWRNELKPIVMLTGTRLGCCSDLCTLMFMSLCPACSGSSFDFKMSWLMAGFLISLHKGNVLGLLMP